MATWDIDYSDAFGVLRKANAEAAHFEEDLTALQTALSGVQSCLTRSGGVSGTFTEYLNEKGMKELEGVFGHTSSAVQGTQDAINAYSQGLYDMAQTAQQNATKAKYPENLPGKKRGGKA